MTSTLAQTQHPWNSNFQNIIDKWGNQKWDTNIVNPNYNSNSFDLETLFESVQRDPRFNRLKTKWSPKLTEKGGLKQKAKNLFDPIHIPYIGAAVAWNRASKLGDARQKLEQLQEAEQGTVQGDVLQPMHTNAKVEQAGMTAKASAKTFFMFFPVVYAVPVGDQALSSVASKATSKAVSKSVQAAAKKAADDPDHLDSAKFDVNETWGTTKALLYYLGEPQNKDPIYHSWEDLRLKLKEFFGCFPQDNLYEMQPKGEDLRRIEDAEQSQGGYDLSTINVPLLVLLWRIYDCWNEQYIDKVTPQKHKMNREKRMRAEDEREVLEMISPVDSHVQELNEPSLKAIVRLFKEQHALAYGNHSSFSFLEERAEEKREKRIGWILKTFVGKLLKSKTGWGYFEDPTNTGEQGQLLAVAFFERAEQDHFDPSDLLNTFSGMMKLRTDYNQLNKRLSWEDQIMKKHVGDTVDRGILHMFACLPSPQGRKALEILIRSQIDYTSIPSYCQEYSTEKERIQLLKSLGFSQRDSVTQDQKDGGASIEVMEFQTPTRGPRDYAVPPISSSSTHAPELKHA